MSPVPPDPLFPSDDDPDASHAVLDALVDEFTDRLHAGEQVNIESFLARLPELRDVLAPLLQTARLMANVETDPAATEGPPLPPNGRIGRYRVKSCLGQGGFGLVYLAYDEQLDRLVAIKVPHAKRVWRPEVAAEHLTEARLVAKLDHRHIVPVYDVGSTDEFPCYMVSKYIDGSTLTAIIKEARPAPAAAAEIVVAVAEALHYAHGEGIVHRDVKPGNILIDRNGAPFIADFGLALQEGIVRDDRRYAGTPAYMSPEQARGEGHRVDGRSDTFSVGVVLYELLVGRKPFAGNSLPELLKQIESVEPIRPRHIDGGIPHELERICLKALSKRFTERYTTAADLADDVRYFLAEASATQTLFSPATNLAVGGAPGPAPDSPPAKIVPKGLRAFDAHDAEFFLELLPGPRDRDGLPGSLRFWKTRIEEPDAAQTFAAGLIYGPSGCGKSSLIKAGLLPRLSENVISVYVEATADDTETRLLAGLRKSCPALSTELGLAETLAALRRGVGLPNRKKVVIVLDQFEQWLHARQDEPASELVRGLRQCDGARVQCLVMVRDDFWLAATRFFGALEVDLRQGQNTALVDLFDPDHARNVLASFGRAFDRLPETSRDTSKEQAAFLDQAVASLAEEGKVICVRLALFAEMMKDKPWTPAVLREVGGTAGVGATFMEETFSASTAHPTHRLHQTAARAVLKALLPETGRDIRGHMRSYSDLLEASGYAGRPQEFDEVIRILDTEIRLITPTDPEGTEDEKNEGGRRKDETQTGSANPSSSPFILHPSTVRYYQLTHDYLVPSLRDWLTRKQKETRRGRAELRLEDRAATWNAGHDDRHLPSLWEFLNIRLFTRRQTWTSPQRMMMRKSAWIHGRRATVAILLLLGATWTAYELNGRTKAEAIVRSLTSAETADVPKLVADLQSYRRWADPLLAAVVNALEQTPKAIRHASLALVDRDPTRVDYLFGELLEARPEDVPVIAGFLSPRKTILADRLWKVVEQPTERPQRLRAAAALAVYAPDDSLWTRESAEIAGDLVSVPAFELKAWTENLRSAGSRLAADLEVIFKDRRATNADERALAAATLAEYLRDEPLRLANLAILADNDREIQPFVAMLRAAHEQVAPILENMLDQTPDPNADTSAPENLWKRQATAAVCLLQLGHENRVWPLLQNSADPSVQSYLIARFHKLGTPFQLLSDRLNSRGEIPERGALVLALGEFDPSKLLVSERQSALSQVTALYRQDLDPGVHGAAEWVLRHWGISFEELPVGGPPKAGWSVNSQGQTMLMIRGPVEFLMSDKVGERPAERKTIPHSFAIAAQEVSVAQFLKFKPGHEYSKDHSRQPECPMNMVSWFDAVAYCNWLSAQEGLPPGQWCYQPNEAGKYADGMTIPPDGLERTGYRLPTDIEWEYACRFMAESTYPCGEPLELLSRYGWGSENSQARSWPIKLLRPNGLGAFDMYGNVMEWCHDLARSENLVGPVLDKETRVLRSSSFIHPPAISRITDRHEEPLGAAFIYGGIRSARTLR